MTTHPPTPQKQDWKTECREKLVVYAMTLRDPDDDGDQLEEDMIDYIDHLISLSISQARKEEREKLRQMVIDHESRDFGYCQGDTDCVNTWELVKDIEALSPKEGEGV